MSMMVLLMRVITNDASLHQHRLFATHRVELNVCVWHYLMLPGTCHTPTRESHALHYASHIRLLQLEQCEFDVKAVLDRACRAV